MTGYGKSEAVFENKKILVEIKSLNSKSLDINTRLAPSYFCKDLQLRQMLMGIVVRGKVDLSIKIEDNGAATTAIINKEVVANYMTQIKDICREVGLNEPLDWWTILSRMPGFSQAVMSNDVSEGEWTIVTKAVEEALTNFVEFRRQEGKAVTQKFINKINNIASYLKEIEKYETTRTEKIRQQIISRLESLPVDYDRNRLEQEMIYYIEKLDINEEKQRLANHLKYFRDTIDSNEAQGKKLGFIAQEMGREINTMGSKSNQAEMQNLVVMMKDELEQIKEQVLNIL